MSYQAQTWAVKITTGSHVAKAVLLHIANYADDAGYCWPSQERLAKELEMGERTVREALARLEEMGVIRRERRYGKDGYRTSDGIRLNPSYRQQPPQGPRGQPAGDAGNEGEILPAGDAAKTLPADGADLTGRLGHSYRQEPPPNNQELPENHHTTRSARGAKGAKKPSYTPDFEALWECIPKENPGSKADAFRAFSKLSKEDQGECMRGWLRYEEWLEGKRKTKADWPIKQLVSFINGRLWESHQEEAA